MWSSAIEEDWDQLTAQVLDEVKAWRAAHPRATLREIEQEVDVRLATARARLVEAAALAEAAAEPVPGRERPRCPACGAAMVVEGTRTRRLTTTHNRDVTLTRRYARCPQCGTGFFPPG